jgi:hypothetical protein
MNEPVERAVPMAYHSNCVIRTVVPPEDGMKRTVSAMDARRHLGEILEGVFYRGDEVVIERAGKVMGVVVSPDRYRVMGQDRERFWELFEQMQKSAAHLTEGERDEVMAEALEAIREDRRKQ